MNRRVLTAEEFFVAGKLKREWVPIPEWNGSENGDEPGVYVTQLDAVERDKWAEVALDDKGNVIPGITTVQAMAVAVVDESGKRIFTPEQLGQLNEQSGVIAWRIFKTFLDLNRLSDGMVEGAKKN